MKTGSLAKLHGEGVSRFNDLELRGRDHLRHADRDQTSDSWRVYKITAAASSSVSGPPQSANGVAFDPRATSLS
jgi:hypothetical protein